MDELIGDIQKNSTEIIRVALTDYKGHQLISCRVHFKNKAGEWCPNRKGLTIKVDAARELILRLQNAVEKLADSNA